MGEREAPPLASGGEEVLAEFFRTYADRIYRHAVGMLGDTAAAEDVVQETFVKALRRLDTFEGRSSVGTWLYRVAHNACVDRLRVRGREVSADAALDGALPMPRNLVDWSATPESELLDAEARQALDSAVAALPETLRAAFLLRDVEGLSTAEAAAALDLSLSALKVRLHRARLKLRETLAEYFAERVQGEAP